MQEAGLAYLEEVERLPPQESGGDQDALLQAPGRAGDGPHIRASGDRVACAGGLAQPIHATWVPHNGGGACCGVAASGVGVISTFFDLCNKAALNIKLLVWHPLTI